MPMIRSSRISAFGPLRTFLTLNLLACNAFHGRYDIVKWLQLHRSVVGSIRLFGAKLPRNREGMGKPKGYFDLKSRYILERHVKSGLPDVQKTFIVLGIESSCDDTGAAIVRSDGTILSNSVYSQYGIHEKFGGIVPSLAMEAHKSNINKAVEDALMQAGLSSINDVDAIAVTRGPGLEICLRVGYRKAQALAREYKKPFVAVHHLEAHCMVARLAGKVIVQEYVSSNNSDQHVTTTPKASVAKVIAGDESSASTSLSTSTKATNPHFDPTLKFPFLALLASGGHTSILLCRGVGDYTVLGGTLDDALGEAFDKAARLLGLRFTTSGGAAVEQAAATADRMVSPFGSMKVPMRDKVNCDFSYAGLKNAFRMAVQESRSAYGLDADCTNAPPQQMEEAPAPVTLPEDVTAALCAQFQDVAFSHVEDRIKRALNVVDRLQVPVTALVVVGGVAANKELRRRLLALLDARAAKANAVAAKIATATGTASSSPDSSIVAAGAQGSERREETPREGEAGGGAMEELAIGTVVVTAITESGSDYKGGNDGYDGSGSGEGGGGEGLHTNISALPLVFPPPALCTDNGVMVAWSGVEKLLMGISDDVDVEDVVARWPLGAPLEDPSVFKRDWDKTTASPAPTPDDSTPSTTIIAAADAGASPLIKPFIMSPSPP